MCLYFTYPFLMAQGGVVLVDSTSPGPPLVDDEEEEVP